jgi:DNA-binding MarR family transcriptional regulator
MNSNEVFTMMDHKYALFGLFFAFHNRLQATGDSFYEEITCKQFFLLACMNLYTEEAPTGNELAKTMGCSRQNIKEILNSFLSADLLHRNSAADNDIKNFLKRAEDKLDEFSEDHQSRRKQADAALKTWYKIYGQITQRRVQLARYQQYRRELKKHTQDIKSLYNRMVNTVKPAGTDAENKLNSLLVDSSGSPRIFTVSDAAELSAVLQKKITVNPIRAD